MSVNRSVGAAAQQRAHADEGRLGPGENFQVGRVIVRQGEVVRAWQLIASVRRPVKRRFV